MTDARVQRVLDEWRQSRRLRIAAMVALLVLALQVATTLAARRDVDAAEYAREAELLDRLDRASRESAWIARANTAEATLSEIRDSMPAAASDGLAQAELQAWLAELADASGLVDARVRIETSLAVPGHDGLWQVLARIDGNTSTARLPDFVRGLAASPWIRAEPRDVTTGRDTRVSAIVRGYYRDGTPATGPGAASQ